MPPIYPGVAHQFALLSLVVFSKKIVKKYCKNKLCCAPHILYPGVADKFALLSLVISSQQQSRFLHKWRH